MKKGKKRQTIVDKTQRREPTNVPHEPTKPG